MAMLEKGATYPNASIYGSAIYTRRVQLAGDADDLVGYVGFHFHPDFGAALAKAQTKLGIISQDACCEIVKHCRVEEQGHSKKAREAATPPKPVRSSPTSG